MLNGIRDNPELRTAKEVLRHLDALQLPEKLEEAYDRSYEAVARGGQAAFSALQILFCAQKALSTIAMLELLMQDNISEQDYSSSVRNLLSRCCGLVTHNPVSDAFEFLHPSVEQYLPKER